MDGALRPPSDFSDIPAPLERIILRCLETKPENRYGGMAELAAALEDCAKAIYFSVTAEKVAAWVESRHASGKMSL